MTTLPRLPTSRMARRWRLPSEICRSLVTIGQYVEFTKATGYVTSFERTGDGSFQVDETI